MRLFLGIDFPLKIKTEINQVATKLRPTFNVPAKWVAPQSFHLTLVFIGEVVEGAVNKLIKTISDASKNIPTIPITIGQPVLLPARHPSVLALETNGGREFSVLQSRLVTAITKLGLPALSYPPHLTLARLSIIKNKAKASQNINSKASNLIKDHSISAKPIKYQALEFTLFQSLTAPQEGQQGPMYKTHKTFKLAPQASAELFRPNVVICLVNPYNEVLTVMSKYHSGVWFFPQGGIDTGESIETAAKRELKEELGISEADIIRVLPNVHIYRWTKSFIRSGEGHSKEGYLGQSQSMVIMKVAARRPKLMLDKREAAAAKWVSLDKLITHLHPLRRKLGDILLREMAIVNAK